MITESLEYFGFIDPKFEFIGHGENMTYKITDGHQCYQLRIHKPMDGFNLDLVRMGNSLNDLVNSEMKVLLYLAEKGNLNTQKVFYNKNGDAITTLRDGTLVTVLEWINGDELSKEKITDMIAYKIGTTIGKLHNSIEYLTIKPRYQYDDILTTVLINETLDSLKQEHFAEKHAKIIVDALSLARDYLRCEKDNFKFIHADLKFANLLYSDEKVVPIDFSLSGYCIPEWDLCMLLNGLEDENLKLNFMDGYQSVCDYVPNDTGIAVCTCMTLAIFVVTQHKKVSKEPWFYNEIDKFCENTFKPFIKTIKQK